MAKFRDDDLFESTKMTFGEHLEELRACLFRAVLGMFVGIAVGLYFGSDVVHFIQTPMQEALTTFYKAKSKTKIKQQLDELPEELSNRIDKEDQIFDDVLIDPAELRAALGLGGESSADASQVAASPLVGIRLWRNAIDDNRISLKSLSAQESFMIWMKAGFIAGLTISSPWIFYQLWIFVGAGLYPHEKRYAYIFLPFSLVLFFAGAALAFFFVFGFVLDFLFTFNSSMGIDPDPRISEWLGFVLMLPLGFGVAFQLPLVMLFLERIGVFTIESYLDKWRVSVLVIAVLSMLLTPADPMSMLLMFVPLTGLYFLGIALCHYMPRSQSPFA